MAGHEWDWFQREELIGQISDIRVQNLQVERENVQKRTFTRWINLHLEKCSPQLEVEDLFVDIQDGKILMALLEVLTGQNLLHEYKSSTHRIFRLNNIAKALKFLEDSNVKLVSIDAAEIADGNPSLVLGLIWNIILFLQIKELTGNLNRMSSSSLSSLPSGSESDASHPSAPATDKSLSVSIKDQRKAIKALLSWVQQRTRKYGVAVQDFAGSWRSGLAFLAVIKAIDSGLVDMKKALERSPRENLEDAFSIAHRSLNIPPLLEPEDVMVDSPDEHSIMTYVTQFLEHFPELGPEDLAGHGEDAPVEVTLVRYRDGPREEEGRIITLPKDEGNDFKVELRTRPLTPPQTHVYTEVSAAEDGKSKDGLRKPHQLLGEAFKKNKRNVEGQAEATSLPNGGDLHPTGYDHPPKEDEEPKYILSEDYHKYCDSSSSFSSISDREPEDPHASTKPSPVSDDSGLVTPHEEDDSFPYVLHHSGGQLSKHMTVFQAYRPEDKEDPEDQLEDPTDEKNPAKVSIIPHDLFYYPHYSVPIADVLQAFADAGPDATASSNTGFDDSSSENRSEDGESFSDDLDGEKMFSGVESEESGADLQDKEQGRDLQDKEWGRDLQDKERGRDLQDKEWGRDLQDKEQRRDLQDKERRRDLQDKEWERDLQGKEWSRDLQDKERRRDLQDKEWGRDLQGKEWGRDLQDKEWGRDLQDKEWGRDLQDKEWGKDLQGKEWSRDLQDKEWGRNLQDKEQRRDLQDNVQEERYTKTASPAQPMASKINGSAAQPAHDLPATNLSYSDYSSQVSTGNPEDSGGDQHEDTSNGQRLMDGMCRIEKEFHVIEDRASRLAAEVEASLQDPWFSRNVQKDARANNRTGPKLHKSLNVRTLRGITESGEDQSSGLRGLQCGAPHRGPPTPPGDLRKMYHVGLLLWFLCYLLLILPDLDVSKVEFLVSDS